jgi:hypothetical protein
VVQIQEQEAFAMKASYNAGNFEIYASSGNGLRVSRAALDNITLGNRSDELSVMKFGTESLTVTASEGADQVLVFMDNDLPTFIAAVREALMICTNGLTLLAIVLNAVWIAVVTDVRKANAQLQPLSFVQVVERMENLKAGSASRATRVPSACCSKALAGRTSPRTARRC